MVVSTNNGEINTIGPWLLTPEFSVINRASAQGKVPVSQPCLSKTYSSFLIHEDTPTTLSW